jgi:tetratricopeptide (TPR) repeat protein
MTVRPVAILARFAAVAALTVATASAQADPDARTQAAAHTRQGQAFFQRGDFERALTEFQTALDLSAEPSLVFNIALCHDRANRPEDALRAFQRYLELAPNGSVADEARTDVARLIPIVEQRAADRSVEQQRQRADAARRAEADRRQDAARSQAEAAARRDRLSRYMMLAGAVVGAGGGVVHLLAWRTSVRMSDHEHDPEPFYADRSTFLIERDVAIGGYIAGGVTLAAGLILALTVPGRESGPRLSAAIMPGGAALAVAWSR